MTMLSLSASSSDGLDGKCVQRAPCVGVNQDAAIGGFCRSDCLAKIVHAYVARSFWRSSAKTGT